MQCADLLEKQKYFCLLANNRTHNSTSFKEFSPKQHGWTVDGVCSLLGKVTAVGGGAVRSVRRSSFGSMGCGAFRPASLTSTCGWHVSARLPRASRLPVLEERPEAEILGLGVDGLPC